MLGLESICDELDRDSGTSSRKGKLDGPVRQIRPIIAGKISPCFLLIHLFIYKCVIIQVELLTSATFCKYNTLQANLNVLFDEFAHHCR